MARLFISHSTTNNAAAIALCGWLAEQGFDDVFVEIDPERGVVPGQRWQEAIKAAAHRCEAVPFLLSPAWLDSRWCQSEFLLAASLDKRIFGLIVEPVPFKQVRIEMAAEWPRRIPPPLAAAMKEAGVFGMVMPRAWGGSELDPMTQFRVIEALAMVDGWVGWCAMIGCDAGYISAFLDQDVARAMFPDLLSAMGAAATPTGNATVVPGGYRVSGRFPFVSGCHHCEWLWLGCHVVEDGAPRINSTGVPETRQCLLRLQKCEILDTWYTTGLRGTGSNDVAVHDQFVPGDQSFTFQDPGLVKRPGPLYAFPFMFAAKGPAVALGIARHALDTLIEASGKPARRYTLGDGVEPRKRLRDDVFVQEAVGRADTLLTSARAHHFDVVGDMWESLVAGEPLSEVQHARFMTLNSHVIALCVEVVQLVFKASGGTAVYQKGPLDRCLRDVLTMNQHVVATLRTWEMSGRLLLGLDPLRWLF